MWAPLKVLPIYGQFDVPLDRILTYNGKEYTTHWANDRYVYEQFLAKHGIRYNRSKPSTPKSNGMVERFNQTLLEEFYQIAMIKKVYSSPAELRDDQDQSINYYNFKRTIGITG